jgi:hypothetical protein
MFRASFVGVGNEGEEAMKMSIVGGEDGSEDEDGDNTNANNHIAATPSCSGISQKLGIRRINVDALLKKYETWLDANPLKARSVVCAVTGALGALLGARRSPMGKGPVVKTEKSVDWLAVLSFAIHGGLVGGPLSFYV